MCWVEYLVLTVRNSDCRGMNFDRIYVKRETDRDREAERQRQKESDPKKQTSTDR